MESEGSFSGADWVSGNMLMVTLLSELSAASQSEEVTLSPASWRIKSCFVHFHPPIICWVRPSWRAASSDPFSSEWLLMLTQCAAPVMMNVVCGTGSVVFLLMNDCVYLQVQQPVMMHCYTQSSSSCVSWLHRRVSVDCFTSPMWSNSFCCCYFSCQ